MPDLFEIYRRLTALFSIGEMAERRPDLVFIDVSKDLLRPVLLHLRDREGFTHLVLLTAVDWIEQTYPELSGGLGVYSSPRWPTPYVHIDARGERKRWRG